MRVRSFDIWLGLLLGFFFFASMASAGGACNSALAFRIESQEISAAQAFYNNQSGVPPKTKEFVSSAIFLRYARSAEVAEMVDYMVTQSAGNYVERSGEWIKELARKNPHRTKMPYLRLGLGEIQAGVQMIDGHLFLLLKAIGVFPNGQNTLADGEASPGLSNFFVKTIVASLLGGHILSNRHPKALHLTITSLASVNSGIKKVLDEKLGLLSYDTIPADEAAAKINDYARAIARGADPAGLNLMPPRDYYWTLKTQRE